MTLWKAMFLTMNYFSKLRDKVTLSTLATLFLVNTSSITPINHYRCKSTKTRFINFCSKISVNFLGATSRTAATAVPWFWPTTAAAAATATTTAAASDIPE